MQNRLTIKDIARLSGVGKSTVSRVLNGETNVSPQTRARVEAVVREHGFTPSKSARAMRGHSNKVVGIIVSRLDSPAENQVLRAILSQFYQQGYDPIVMESRFELPLLKEQLRMLAHRQVDGLILFAFNGIEPDLLEEWRTRMVVLARHYAGFSSICYDDAGAVALLMQRLHQQGHRHIAYLGVEEQDETTGHQRYQAYLAACERWQLSPRAVLGALSYQSGYQHAARVIDAETTALVCATDTLALGASKYLRQHPQLSVQIGAIGNTPLLTFLFPEVMCVEFGYESAGQLAAKQLLTQFDDPDQLSQYLVPSAFPA